MRKSRFVAIVIWFVLTLFICLSLVTYVTDRQISVSTRQQSGTRSLTMVPAAETRVAELEQTASALQTQSASQVQLAVLNVSSESQPDGTIRNTASLSIAPLGIGSLQLTTPAVIKLGESSVVRLAITPDSALTGLPQATITALSPNDSGHVLQFSDRVQIYPSMIANLEGINFEVTSDGYPEKPIVSSSTVEWIWSVTPKASGKQTLVLTIAIPVIIDQIRDLISVQPLKSIPIEILVEGTPTPTSAIERIGERLIENAPLVLGTLLAFTGTMFTVFASIQNSRRQAAVENLKQQAAKDAQERERLDREIARLRSIRWWQFWRR